jgi:hypothetical protein
LLTGEGGEIAGTQGEIRGDEKIAMILKSLSLNAAVCIDGKERCLRRIDCNVCRWFGWYINSIGLVIVPYHLKRNDHVQQPDQGNEQKCGIK